MPEYYKAGIYIRLSEADEGKSYESESESVLNQRNILMNFIKEKGFIFVDEYVDDGYSGTTFDRPGCLLYTISEPTRQAEISYAVFCLKKKKEKAKKN